MLVTSQLFVAACMFTVCFFQRTTCNCLLILMRVWLLSQLNPQAPGLWLLVSALSGAILLLLWGQLSGPNRRYAQVARWLLVPYLGLISGGLSPRLMGLSNIDWLVGLSLGIGISFVVLAALLIVRATTLFSTSVPERPARLPAPIRLTPYGAAWLRNGAEEFHWSFLRGGLWELLLALPATLASPAYMAVWLAAAFATVELLIFPHSGRQRLVKLTILVATTILFLYTRNFWLCWLLHTGGRLILQPVEHGIGLQDGKWAHPNQ